MPAMKKRGDFLSPSPLNNPPSPESASTTDRLKCKYCDWTGVSFLSLQVHLSRYHEAVVAEEGERARERGRRYIDYFHENHWGECAYLGVLCPGPKGVGVHGCRGWEQCFRKQFWTPEAKERFMPQPEGD